MTREEKARWLSEIYAAIAEGKTLQYRIGSKWHDDPMDDGPYFYSNPEDWRIKPEPRECVRPVVGTLFSRDGHWVKVPDDWPSGTKVRVTEILE
jgi:hypothetical protein